jgi:hypothetical protein
MIEICCVSFSQAEFAIVIFDVPQQLKSASCLVTCIVDVRRTMAFCTGARLTTRPLVGVRVWHLRS